MWIFLLIFRLIRAQCLNLKKSLMEAVKKREYLLLRLGRDFTDDTIKEIIDSLAPDYVTGLTLLGGEPFEHSNQQGLLPLLREVRRIYPDLSIWCFTGYLFDKDIVEKMCNEWKETKEMLQYIDVIVDGKYEEDKKDMMLQFKGSSNQRTILVKESLESGNVVLLYD